MRHVLAACLAILAALCIVAPASAAGLRLTVWPVPPMYSGTTYYLGVGIEKEDRNDGLVHHAPFTFRTILPPGVEYTGYNGGWTCSTPPGNLRDVTCVYATDLHFWMPGSSSLQINARVAPNVVPGPVDVVGTIASAEVPLPPTPVCGASPGTTGCVRVSTNYVASQIRINDWGYTNGTVTNGPVAVWTGGAFEAGTQNNIVMVGIVNSGYGPPNSPVTLDVTLPQGFVFDSGAGLPVWTCAALTPATRVRCTTPYMIDQQYGWVSLRVNVSNDVPVPGPLFLYASIANDVQAAPADCLSNPMQAGCGRLQVPTRVPRVPVLVGDSITHTPTTFRLGSEQGPIVVAYRNIGEANAGATTIWTQLPPFFEFLGTYASNPGATCSAQGVIAAGQVVRCQVAAVGTGPFGTGYVSLRVKPLAQAAAPGPLPVIAAFDLANPSSDAILASCMNNPAQAFCAHDAIPTFLPCGALRDDNIYCDGFDVRQPQ